MSVFSKIMPTIPGRSQIGRFIPRWARKTNSQQAFLESQAHPAKFLFEDPKDTLIKQKQPNNHEQMLPDERKLVHTFNSMAEKISEALNKIVIFFNELYNQITASFKNLANKFQSHAGDEGVLKATQTTLETPAKKTTANQSTATA